jgi:hypothetical protein
MFQPAFLLAVSKRLSLLPIIAAVFVSGCSEPAAPNEAALQSHPRSIVVIDGKPQVYNLQLRSIDDPNIRSQGHVLFNLTENADGTFTLAWTGRIFNPRRESFTGFSVAQVGIGRPAILVSFGEVDGINDRLIEPEGGDIISAELAASLFGGVEPDDSGQEPDGPDFAEQPPDGSDFHLLIVFYTVERPAGALIGTL